MYCVIVIDKDEGFNVEIFYSIEEGNEYGKFFIELKIGVVLFKKFLVVGEYDIFFIKVVDNGCF